MSPSISGNVRRGVRMSDSRWLRPLLMTAVLTGVFCMGFALFVEWLTETLALGQVVGISFVSGFLGSIFAQTVVRRWREAKE